MKVVVEDFLFDFIENRERSIYFSSLLPKAFEPDPSAILMQELGKLNYTRKQQKKAEEILLELLDKAQYKVKIRSGDKSQSKAKSLTITDGEDETFYNYGPEFIRDGIRRMFSILLNNKHLDTAPDSPKDRMAFYEKVLKGLAYAADIMKSGFEDGTLVHEEIYSCLELIGDGGYHCAGRYREVVATLIKGFSDIVAKHEKFKDLEKDEFKSEITKMFAKAREIEAEKLANEFADTCGYVDGSTRVHYILFFKRYLNARENFNLVILETEDTFIKGKEHELIGEVERFLRNISIYDLIQRTFLNLFNERIENAQRAQKKMEVLLGELKKRKEERKEIQLDQTENEDLKFYNSLRIRIGDIYDQHVTTKKDGFLVEGKKVSESKAELLSNRDQFISTLATRINDEDLQNIAVDFDASCLLILLRYMGYIQVEKREVEVGLKQFMIKKGFWHNDGICFEVLPDVFESDGTRISFVDFCIKYNSVDILKKLISERFISDLIHVFHKAVEENREQIVKFILDEVEGVGVNPNIPNMNQETALMIAAKLGHVNIIKLLLKKGADPLIRCKGKYTALSFAVANDRMEAVKALVDFNADEWYLGHALMVSIYKCKHEIAEFILKAIKKEGENFDWDHEQIGYRVFMVCAIKNNAEIARLLIYKRIGKNSQPDGMNSKNLLILAVENDSINVIKLLLESGAISDSQCEQKTIALVKVLSKDLNEQREDIIKLLLEYGANPNGRDEHGCTALIIAAMNGRKELVGLFLSYGADISLKNLCCKTADDVASKEIKSILKKPNPLTIFYNAVIERIDLAKKKTVNIRILQELRSLEGALPLLKDINSYGILGEYRYRNNFSKVTNINNILLRIESEIRSNEKTKSLSDYTLG